jgi:hypothetical protein
MAVDAVNPNTTVTLTGGDSPSKTTSQDTGSKSVETRKVDPNSDEPILDAAIEAFLPGMISNTLMLNNSLFNFAKEAIDEGDEG